MNLIPSAMMWLIPVLVVVVILMTIVKQYKICPNDRVMVIYGAGTESGGARIIHGGGALVIPIIQSYKYMSLAPMSITVDLSNALSANNIRVNVPSQFTVSIASKKDELMQNAVRFLLDLTPQQIENASNEIIIGSLRAVVATLTIEELTRDRERFISLIDANVRTELNKIGMDLVNVNIRDITDESGYIKAMGQKAASEAINQANIDVAEQDRIGSSGVESNNRQRDITVAEQKSLAEIGKKEADKNRDVRSAELKAETVTGQNESMAKIADTNAQLAIREATAFQSGEVAKARAKKIVADEQREAEEASLAKENLPKAKIAKEQLEIEAEAKAEQVRRLAKGDADSMMARYEAEAAGLQKVLEAKANGYKRIIEATGSSEAAATLMMIEKMEDVVRINAEALANLKIDKITVWDSGSGSGSGNDGIKGFLQNFTSALPAMHEIAQQNGVKLPDLLGSIVGEDRKSLKKVENA